MCAARWRAWRGTRISAGSFFRTASPRAEPASRFATCLPMNPGLDDLKQKALALHERLCAAYGCPIPYFHAFDPLSELISSLLSHRTRNADSGRAFKALRARYADWGALMEAPTEEVEATIRGVTWPEQKAPRLQAVLRAIERSEEPRGGKEWRTRWSPDH